MKNLCIHILAAVMFAAAGISASAQVGVHVGASMPYQRMLRLDPLAISERYGLGAYAGADYDIHIAKGFSIVPGLYYSFTIAVDEGFEEGFYAEERQKDHLIRVPVHFRYEFDLIPDRFAIHLYAGPALSVGVASKSVGFLYDPNGIGCMDVVFDNYSGNLEQVRNPSPGFFISEEQMRLIWDAIQEELDRMEPTQRRVDVQMDCGVGFMFRRHWALRAGYTFGLIDRLNGAYSHNFNLKQNQCYIGFGYRF